MSTVLMKIIFCFTLSATSTGDDLTLNRTNNIEEETHCRKYTMKLHIYVCDHLKGKNVPIFHFLIGRYLPELPETKSILFSLFLQRIVFMSCQNVDHHVIFTETCN